MTKMQDNANGRGMRLTARDRAIVLQVSDFNVLSRQQFEALALFKSKTRANAVLLRLVRFGYLSRRHQPAVAGTQKALYFLGPLASEILQRPEANVRKERGRIKGRSDLFLEHQLLVNEVRIEFLRHQFTERWQNEESLRQLSLGVVADGYVEYRVAAKRFAAFLELDRGTESLNRWAQKVSAYLKLAASGSHKPALGLPYFRVLVVTLSTNRLEHLRRTTSKLTDRIFWFIDLPTLRREGPRSRIWLRARATDRHELTEP